MFKTIPGLNFVPSMGNHEPFPVNVYNFYGQRDLYLREALANSWESWIGTDSAMQERTLGYYSTVIQKYNLKIVSLNM
jgi:sphingomyelin phosphodiesterase